MSEVTHISELSQDPKNARRRTDRSLGHLVKSIEAVGFARSIVIDEDGRILAGNGTVDACGEVGIERVRVVEADGNEIIAVRRSGLTPEQKIQLAVGDNRSAELATWDLSILAELSEEADLSAFWFPDELAELLAGPQETPADGLLPGADPDAVPGDVETRCKAGDLWRLGDDKTGHRLLCADATKPEDVARLLDGAKAALMVTDPPYGIGASSMTMGAKQSSLPKASRLSQGQQWDETRPDITSLLSVSKWACIWGGNYFSDVLPVSNDWLCWHKKNDDRSFSEFELAWTNYGRQCRHLDHHWGGEEKQHITQKPVAVMCFAVEQCPDQDGLIFDPYLGSGTTLIAAHRLGRRAYGCEISPMYCDIAISRFEQATGLSAVRISGAD